MKDIRQISVEIDPNNKGLVELIGDTAFDNWKELKEKYKKFSLDVMTKNGVVNSVFFTSEDENNNGNFMVSDFTSQQEKELTEILKSADKENFSRVSNIATGEKWENKTKEEIEEKEKLKSDKLVNPQALSVMVRKNGNRELYNILTTYISALGKQKLLKKALGEVYTLVVDGRIATVGIMLNVFSVDDPLPRQEVVELNKIQYNNLVNYLKNCKIKDFVIYIDLSTNEFYEEGIKKDNPDLKNLL